MYATCIGCQRRLGTNALIPNLPIGRRIAYDMTHGRLWVVCRHCGQWNLTPLEDRWEALEQCEAAFHRASAHVATGDIGVAHTPGGTELVRIGGNATRSDIANRRYGNRLHRRRRLFLVVGLGAAGLAAAVLLAVGHASGSTMAVAWVAALLIAWLRYLPEAVSWRALVRRRTPDGDSVAIRASDLPAISFVSRGTHKPYVLECTLRGRELRIERQEVADLLGVLLPKMNWRSGSAENINTALAFVERAEESAEQRPDGRAIWERVLGVGKRARLLDLSIQARLALEMAVNEDIEIRALEGSAIRLRPALETAARVAAIADSLLLPPFVADWLARHSRTPKHERGSAA